MTGQTRSGGAVAATTVIEPQKSWLDFRLRELWGFRELLFFLVWRDIKVRYKQTLLGAAWAILQPFMTMVVFTIFFGNLAGIASEGVPYPIFSYTALLVWTLVAQGLTQSSQSLVGSANLIRKVYFPRIVIPLSSILAGMVDFALAFLMLLAMMVYFGVWPGPNIVFLPLLLVIAVGTTLGTGLWLSALNVRYRDVRYVVPFLIQIWLFVTPVIYPASVVAARLEALHIPSWTYGLNPMVGVVEGFRWALLSIEINPWPFIAASSASAVFLVVTGLLYFRHTERTIADVV
jgi:lipopolysaccharide transport system permease protein